MSNSVFIIDPQNDFCSKNGSLSVPGAEDDCTRFAQFIKNNSNKIDSIHVTLDCHPYFHIAHPDFWRDEEGKEPAPYTTITYKDFSAGKFVTAIPELSKRADEYISTLENSGRYQLTIWPPHCIIATEGFCVYKDIDNAIHQWEKDVVGRSVDFIVKTRNPLTEHYSAIHAEVPDPSDSSTRTNFTLIDKLKGNGMIYVGGEALSHCVANTLRDLCVYIEPKKITLLEDCSSSVAGFDEVGRKFLEEYVSKGMHIASAESLVL
jgi:nicotinamidase-related amidase